MSAGGCKGPIRVHREGKSRFESGKGIFLNFFLKGRKKGRNFLEKKKSGKGKGNLDEIPEFEKRMGKYG